MNKKKKKRNAYQEFMDFVDSVVKELLIFMMICVVLCVLLQVAGRTAGDFIENDLFRAAAAEGKSLEEVAAIAQRFADNMATLAVAVRGATHPSTGAALADLGEDDMEIGMGQHGEGGGGRQPMKSADETAEIMVNALVKDIEIQPGEKVMLIINGSGATTLMEQLIIYRKCEQVLKAQGIEIVANYVGELLTVQEQAGFQMFMARMDDELLRLWNAPCKTPYLTK